LVRLERYRTIAQEANCMPKPHIWTALILASALIAVPASGDGKDTGRPVAGPEPLAPHAQECTSELEGGQDCTRQQETRRVYRKAAPKRTHRIVRRAAAPVTQRDFSGLTGGVGAGVAAGFHGGAGRIVILGDRTRYSGVLQSRAAAFTFRRSGPTQRPHPRPTPCCGMK
jgi:hypothetical protein